jgi:GNAT superfamily N-acetyltransferase
MSSTTGGRRSRVRWLRYHPGVIVVPATRADAPGVIELIGRVFAEYGWIWDPPAEVPDLLRWTPHYEPPHGAFFVIRREGVVVGSVGVDHVDDTTAELHRLYLDPGVRGRGLGDALVDTIVAWCRSERVRRLLLWSDTRFVHAHRLYLRHGFRQTAERVLPEDVNQTREYRFERDV